MAEKMIFISDVTNSYYEKIINYVFVPGFAPSQRKKNVTNLKNAISSQFANLKSLEISTKSDSELGRQLSAFNLKLDGFYLECIFQSSKVFADGSQYDHLISKKPIEAKRFIQSLPQKEIVKFRYKGINYPIIPKSMFYDFLYANALRAIPTVSNQLREYSIFTDIEFNYKKSINCQARACAIYSYLLKINKVDEFLSDIKLFETLYKGQHSAELSLFDFDYEK